jgi:long-chain acyl-CoA synthetase
VHAIVVLRPGVTATEAELDAHCRSQMGAYKCPKSYEFRDKLPLTAAGKVQKTELRKSVQQGRAV